jgi:hypothetical protein
VKYFEWNELPLLPDEPKRLVADGRWSLFHCKSPDYLILVDHRYKCCDGENATHVWELSSEGEVLRQLDDDYWTINQGSLVPVMIRSKPC